MIVKHIRLQQGVEREQERRATSEEWARHLRTQNVWTKQWYSEGDYGRYC